MAFLRFSRDKRGVENFYLVQPTTNRRGKVRPRVLYWFRSPPDVKVGREPFDEHVRRELEAQNPDITFDWQAIVETPIPSADADKWRERRRAERVAKHAAADEESAEAASGEADMSTPPAPDAPVEAPVVVAASSVAQPPQSAESRGDANRKRRGRRRGPGGRGGNAPAVTAPGVIAPAASTPASTEPSGD